MTTGDFEAVQSLRGAVEVVQGRLKRDGKPEYAALLSEVRVREAIRTAIRSYEAVLDQADQRHPGSKEYFEQTVKPVCLRIADAGAWPPGCSFFSFYTLRERGDGQDIAYDGLGLRLQIETP